MKVRTAKYRMENFSWKDDQCPICKKKFRSKECSHTNRQAHNRLFEDYVKALSQ